MGLLYHFVCPGCNRQATVMAIGSLAETFTCPSCHHRLLMDETSITSITNMKITDPDVVPPVVGLPKVRRFESTTWFRLSMIAAVILVSFLLGTMASNMSGVSG